MKIKISRNYGVMETIRESDNYINNHTPSRITTPNSYHQWEDMDVTFDELRELINQGHGIMINC